MRATKRLSWTLCAESLAELSVRSLLAGRPAPTFRWSSFVALLSPDMESSESVVSRPIAAIGQVGFAGRYRRFGGTVSRLNSSWISSSDPETSNSDVKLSSDGGASFRAWLIAVPTAALLPPFKKVN